MVNDKDSIHTCKHSIIYTRSRTTNWPRHGPEELQELACDSIEFLQREETRRSADLRVSERRRRRRDSGRLYGHSPGDSCSSQSGRHGFPSTQSCPATALFSCGLWRLWSNFCCAAEVFGTVEHCVPCPQSRFDLPHPNSVLMKRRNRTRRCDSANFTYRIVQVWAQGYYGRRVTLHPEYEKKLEASFNIVVAKLEPRTCIIILNSCLEKRFMAGYFLSQGYEL